MQNPRLSKDEIAGAALHILDELGLPDLTMRRLAADLHVRPSALYWYYPNKQTLLADLADRILSQGLPAKAAARWEDQLHMEACALRDALLTYRDSAEIVLSSLALGLGANPAHSRLCRALQLSPFSAESTQQASATMLHFILGHVSLEQQRLQYDSLGALSGDHAQLRTTSREDDFQFGVDTVIAGLQQRTSTTSVPTQRQP